MIISQNYKIKNKKTKEVIVFDGDNYSQVASFLQKNNAILNYKEEYEIYFCHESIVIIDGIEKNISGESRLSPIFLYNKKTKEIITCNTMPVFMQYIEGRNVADYEFIYDDSVDKGNALAQYQKLLLNKTKEDLLKDLDAKYEEALTIRVKNGVTFSLSLAYFKYLIGGKPFKNAVDFSISLSSKEGSDLLTIIDEAKGAYSDDRIAKFVQSFYFIETIKGESTMQETRMFNWLWLYIFGELPLLYKKIKQLKESYSIDINAKNDIEGLSSINIVFPSKISIDIPKAMKYMMDNDTDIVDGIEITIPAFIKDSMKDTKREVFIETTPQNIESEINLVIENSFFDKSKESQTNV